MIRIIIQDTLQPLDSAFRNRISQIDHANLITGLNVIRVLTDVGRQLVSLLQGDLSIGNIFGVVARGFMIASCSQRQGLTHHQ